jgi:hypothetical protein
MHPTDHYHNIIRTFHFLVPPNLFLDHKDNHMLGLIFFNHLLFSSSKNFEHMNTVNPSHQSNNAIKKGKKQNNNNLGPGGNQNQPQQNQPVGGNQNQGNQNSQGGNNNKCQGKNNNCIQTNFPFALCSEYGQYAHHCPQIVDFKWMKESGNGPCLPAPPPPQQAPQKYVQHPPPTVLRNPIPHQGVMNTQQGMQPTPP